MKYENYTTADFIEDSYFIKWVEHPDEQSDKFWKIWLAEHPEKRKELMLARQIVGNIAYEHDPQLKEADYVEMFENIIRKNRKPPASRKKGLNIKLPHLSLRIAATISLVLLSAATLLLLKPWRSSPVVSSNIMVEKVSPIGVKITTWLEDGTKVRLNAGSILRYPKQFSDSLRIVYVEGEAFFEVKKNEKKPFVVNTSRLKATVLGTSFNVRAYPEEKGVQIAVAEGKVRVNSKKSESAHFVHVLTTNQMTSYNIEKQQAIKTNFDPEEILAWKDGILKFNNLSLPAIFHQLEKWYGVKITLSNRVDALEEFSGSFDNESLEVVLQALQHQCDFNYKIIGKEIRITKK